MSSSDTNGGPLSVESDMGGPYLRDELKQMHA